MIKVYPFASGSEYTASFAISASHANTAHTAGYVYTASLANEVIFPTSGSAAAVNICRITYDQYLQILSGSGSVFEQCNFI